MSTKDEQEILSLDRYLELKEQEYEFEGQSYLFWEYMRLLNEVKPKYFLLENVMMGEKWEKILSKAIGVKPIMINSSLLSAQNRQRLYWTNIGLETQGLFGDLESTIQQPKDKGVFLKDILEPEVDNKFFLSETAINRISSYNNSDKSLNLNDKSLCLAAGYAKQGRDNQLIVHNMQTRSADRPSLKENKNAGGSGHLSKADGKTYCLDVGNTQAIEVIGLDYRTDEGLRFRENGKSPTLTCKGSNEYGGIMASVNKVIRRLTPVECERLQTVKDNYTNYVSDSQRYKMLGNGWTVDVIAHIFKYIK